MKTKPSIFSRSSSQFRTIETLESRITPGKVIPESIY